MCSVGVVIITQFSFVELFYQPKFATWVIPHDKTQTSHSQRMGSIQAKRTVVFINDEVINHNNMISEYPTHNPPIQMMLYHIAVYINFY